MTSSTQSTCSYSRRTFSRLLHLAFVLALCLAGGMSAYGQDELAPTADAWQYSFLKEPTTPNFNVRFRLEAKSAQAVRIVFDSGEGENLFFIEIGREGAAWGLSSGRHEYILGRERKVKLADLAGNVVVLERRPHRWSLCSDGRMLLSGDDPPPAGTRVGFGTTGGDALITEVRVQRLSGILFSDDFMRTEEDPTSWTELDGTWRLDSLKNPMLSANAFKYVAIGEPEATAITGEWFWSDLDIQVACCPAKQGAIGLYLCYRGPDDYVLFRWSSNDSAEPKRQLIRKKGDVETVLTESDGGYAPGQWYRLKILLGAGWARICVGDALLMTVYHPALTFGKVGLFAEGKDETYFDDVHIQSRPAISIDFGEYHLGEWLISGGKWIQMAAAPWRSSEWSGGVIVQDATKAKALWGQSDWKDYLISARLGSWESGAVGLCFRYLDNDNYYRVQWVKGKNTAVELWKTEHGKDERLARTELAHDGQSHTLEVVSQEDRIVVSVDQKRVLSTLDDSFNGGRMGLYASDVKEGHFSDIFCRFLQAQLPLPKHHRAFSAETVSDMVLWAGAESDWAAGKQLSGFPAGANLMWHRLDFYGDVRMDIRLGSLPEHGQETGIALCGRGEDSRQGVVARIRTGDSTTSSAPTDEEARVVLELLSDGEVVGTQPLTREEGAYTLSLRRAGNLVAAYVGGRKTLSCRTASPRETCRMGWYASGTGVTLDDVEVYCDNAAIYNFETAPTQWRIGSGLWEISSKWQCDPRWSFFSGRSDRLAVLWNRLPLHGDFTIIFYVGNKMDQDRGMQYEYAQDMNISVCGDGKQLNTGYSFLFGGFDNTVTAGYRLGKRWAVPEPRNRLLIQRGGELHRKWYQIILQRTGNRFEMRVGDRVNQGRGALHQRIVLSQEDKNPLENPYWALWTRNNGIMIGRVLVSAEEIGPAASMDSDWPRTTESVYSMSRGRE